MIDIKDYLPYYIGQKCETDHGVGILEGVNIIDSCAGTWAVTLDEDSELYTENDCEWIKPILRRLSDMTEEEMKGIWEVIFQKPFHNNGSIRWIDNETRNSCKRWVLSSGVERVGIELNGTVWADSDLANYKFNPNLVFHYLLKQGFDLFNLIDNNLAVDAKTLNQPL